MPVKQITKRSKSSQCQRPNKGAMACDWERKQIKNIPKYVNQRHKRTHQLLLLLQAQEFTATC